MSQVTSLRAFGQAPDTALNGSTLQTLFFFFFFSTWDLQLSFMQSTTPGGKASRTFFCFPRGGVAGTTLVGFEGFEFVCSGFRDQGVQEDLQ